MPLEDLHAPPAIEPLPGSITVTTMLVTVSTVGPRTQNTAQGQDSFADLITELLCSPREQMGSNHPLGQSAL